MAIKIVEYSVSYYEKSLHWNLKSYQIGLLELRWKEIFWTATDRR